MDVKDFYYDLPQELIAQDPLEDRSSSRLMVLDKATGEVEHRHFKDIVDYLRPGDCLVINNTKVIPARLYGVKEGTEAKIEILLLKRKENDVWETLVKPGKKCKIGRRGPSERDVPGGAEQWARRARAHLRQDAAALHPHPPRGPRGRGAEPL